MTALIMIIKLGSTLLITFILFGCSSNFRTVGLVNNTDREIIIETRPNLRYNGGPEKYIGLEEDSSNRGLVWKFGPINCIIVRPLGSEPVHDSIGKYIMKPKSGFWIGDFYKPTDVGFSEKCVDINYLEIVTARDTLILKDKKEIWNALNYHRDTKRDRKIIYNKAIVVN
jgi:hypothetical protein